MGKIYQATTLDKNKVPPLDTIDVTESSVVPLDRAASQRKAILLDGERGVTLYDIEPFDRWTPFTCVITFRETQRHPLRSVIAHHSRGTDAGYNGWDLTIEDGFVESRLYRVWPGNAMGVRTTERIPVNRWHQLTATYDGSLKAEGLKLYLNGQPLETTILRNKMHKSANAKVDHGGNFVVGQRFRARGFAGAKSMMFVCSIAI